MASIVAKPKARRGMTIQSAPSYFVVFSNWPRVIKPHPGKSRSQERRQFAGFERIAGEPKPAGAKLARAFDKSGNAALHATKTPHVCYGRRSERTA